MVERSASPLTVWLTPIVNVLVPGTYAWVATVAVPAFGSEGGLAAQSAACAAWLALVLGALFAMARPRLGRGLGILGFAAASVLTWVLVKDSLSIARMDAVRGALGGFGWLLTALGWGALRTARVPEADPRARPGPPLEPRRRLPFSSAVMLAVAFAGAAGPLVMAWNVNRPSHAAFAQAIAAAAAIAMVTVGGIVAVERSPDRPAPDSVARLRNAGAPLALLVAALGAGLLWRALG